MPDAIMVSIRRTGTVPQDSLRLPVPHRTMGTLDFGVTVPLAEPMAAATHGHPDRRIPELRLSTALCAMLGKNKAKPRFRGVRPYPDTEIGGTEKRTLSDVMPLR